MVLAVTPLLHVVALALEPPIWILDGDSVIRVACRPWLGDRWPRHTPGCRPRRGSLDLCATALPRRRLRLDGLQARAAARADHTDEHRRSSDSRDPPPAPTLSRLQGCLLQSLPHLGRLDSCDRSQGAAKGGVSSSLSDALIKTCPCGGDLCTILAAIPRLGRETGPLHTPGFPGPSCFAAPSSSSGDYQGVVSALQCARQTAADRRYATSARTIAGSSALVPPSNSLAAKAFMNFPSGSWIRRTRSKRSKRSP